METRPKNDSSKVKPAKASKPIEKPPDDKESEEEQSPNPATATRLTRLRVAAAAQASARRNSATAAARRSLAKAKSSMTSRTIVSRYPQAVRRSSRTTPGSKKLEAEEQAALEEADKEKSDLERMKRKFHRLHIMEVNRCLYNEQLWRLSDIISIRGAHDGNPYYARIIGFFRNLFGERYVCVRWLIPKPDSQASWTKGFNMDLFDEGPVGEHLISMENITHVDSPGLPRHPINGLGGPYILHRKNRVINLMAEKPLSSL